MTIGRGGARPGSGPKSEGYEASGSQAEYDAQKARHERIKADEREFKLAVSMGEYIERSVVQQASATVLSMLTQSLNSLADVLERSAGLTPAQARIVDDVVAAACRELANGLRAMTPDGPAA